MIITPSTGHLPDNLGFFSWFGYELPFVDRLAHVRNAGFSRISIWLGPEEQMVTEGRAAYLSRCNQRTETTSLLTDSSAGRWKRRCG